MKRNRAPEDGWFLRHGTSLLLTAFMAKAGITDEGEGWSRLGEALRQLIGAKPGKYGQSYAEYILEKVRTKQRQYNTGLNGQEREPGQDEEEGDQAERAYRRASRGH
jgi:hypothetical protein